MYISNKNPLATPINLANLTNIEVNVDINKNYEFVNKADFMGNLNIEIKTMSFTENLKML